MKGYEAMMTSKDGSHLIVPGDPLLTIKNCGGYYDCPTTPAGVLQGPLVGYTASYDAPGGGRKNWVGFTYLNFATADPWPAVLTYFAEAMTHRIREARMGPDLIVGAPWAGVKFSQEVARLLGCRHIFAEKKGEDLVLGRYEDVIKPGMRVLVGEELVNNTSTTGKLIKLIEAAGGVVVGIICAINRSSPFKNIFWAAPEGEPIRIIGVIEREIPQYQQHDPCVAGEVEKGNIIWKPKYDWDKLKAAMDAAV